MNPSTRQFAQHLNMYRARDFKVASGYNPGAEVSYASELTLDDVYQLQRGARPYRIDVTGAGERQFCIQPESEAGQAGNLLTFDCVMTLMSRRGDVVETLVLVETDADTRVHDVYVLPLAGLQELVDYVLIGVDATRPQARFGEMAFVSFGAGTLITMGNGSQRPIEALQPGDMILTRDDDVQPLLWIGHSTVRAVGDFAPVRVRAQTLNNHSDLVLSPDHRLMIYQRKDQLSVGRAEVMVRARHLVNGKTVVQETGGFVDYYQMLFQDHHLVFAEGVAAETLYLNARTRYALPPDVVRRVKGKDHRDRRHMQFEIDAGEMTGQDLVNLLYHATRGS